MCSCMRPSRGKQSGVLAYSASRVAQRRVGDFVTQELAIIAWAYATAGRSFAPLFVPLEEALQLRMDRFITSSLVKMAWAFATADGPAPALLDPVAVLDAVEALGATPWENNYQMSVQSLTAACQIEA